MKRHFGLAKSIYDNGSTICQKFRVIPFESDSIKNSVTLSNCDMLELDALSLRSIVLLLLFMLLMQSKRPVVFGATFASVAKYSGVVNRSDFMEIQNTFHNLI